MKSLLKWFVYYNSYRGEDNDSLFIYGYNDSNKRINEKITGANLTENGISVYSGNSVYLLEYGNFRLHSKDNELYYPDALKDFCVLYLSENIFNMIAEDTKARIEKMNAEKAALCEHLDEELENGMIYIELSDECSYYFSRAVYKSMDGKTQFAVMSVHEGLAADSVVIRDEDHRECDIRYFPHSNNEVEFYDTLYHFDLETPPAGTKLGIISNVGKNPINIRFT